MDMGMGIDWTEVVRRALKYLFEGLAVALAAYYVVGKRTKLEEIAMIAITAAATYALLDMYTPTIAVGARFGTGFMTGSNLAGGL